LVYLIGGTRRAIEMTTKEDEYKAMLARQKKEEKHGFLLEREKKDRGLPAFGKPGADQNFDERERKRRDGSASRSPSRDRRRDRNRDRKDRRSSSGGGGSSDSRSSSRERRRRKKKRKKHDRDRDRDRRTFRETSGSPDADVPSIATTVVAAEEQGGGSAAGAGLCVHSAPPSGSAARDAAAAGAGTALHNTMEVAEGLYLGNATVCASAEGVRALRQLGVTHVINATTLAPMPRVPDDAEGLRAAFSCTRIPLSADPSAPVAKYFEQAASAVHAAVSSQGKVLLCCAGDSTAAAAAAAATGAAGATPLGSIGSASAALGLYYLMRHRGLSLRECLDALRRAQPDALPSVWHAQRLMEAEVRMHELPEPTVSADEYRRLCLLQLCHRATAATDSGGAPATAGDVEALTSRLRAARQLAAGFVGAS